ncbi:MAG: hypothetical protein Q7K21_09835, partial [Elusimicrobiota bacterium]|nr:hypothetical protein [Elusimicrobiota bacterium]
GWSGLIDVTHTSPYRLQVILPGETAVQGKWNNGTNPPPYGKTGTPDPRTAGTSFTATVNGVDIYWNKITSLPQSTSTIKLDTSDIYDINPTNKALTDGSTTFSVTLVTVSTYTVAVASDATVNYYPNDPSSSALVSVGPGAKTRLQVLVPGETQIPGKWNNGVNQPPYGKTGNPDTQTAGSPFKLTVNGVDNYWNTVTGDNSVQVWVNTDDNFDVEPSTQTLVSGSTAFWINLRVTGLRKTTGYAEAGVYSMGSSTFIPVSVGDYALLQILVPGETAVPGDVANLGKTGAPSTRTAGTPFIITVNAVDVAYNINPSVVSQIDIWTTDPNDNYSNDSVPNAVLQSGTTYYPITMVTASLWSGTTYTVTAYDLDSTDPFHPQDTSPGVPTTFGDAVKLQVLLPGETANPGYSSGKTGTPGNATAGTPFTITVNGVDSNWNRNLTASDNVTIQTTDNYDTEPPSGQSLMTGTTNFNITFRTGAKVLTPNATHQICATQQPGYALSSNTSTVVTAVPGAAAKLLIILPGESAVAGKNTDPNGKTGNPGNWTAGTSTGIVVVSVDANWNVKPAQPSTRISLSDLNNPSGRDSGDVFNPPYQELSLLASGYRTFSVTPYTVGLCSATAWVAAGGYNQYTSTKATVVAGDATQLQVLVPGETARPGDTANNGKTGSPAPQTAGTGFKVTINACDDKWNVNSADTSNIEITTTDNYDTADPATRTLQSGVTYYNATFVTSEGVGSGLTLTAVDNSPSPSSMNPGTSANVPMLPGDPERLLILVPDETALPGSSSTGGKTGSITSRTAGTPFDVTIRAVDNNWNITNSSPIVQLTTFDKYDIPDPQNFQLEATGTKTASITFVTSGISSMTVDDTEGWGRTYNLYITPQITVLAGAPVKLQLLIPGESSSPGSSNGKSGIVTPRTAGQSFDVTVNLVDTSWNKVTNTGYAKPMPDVRVISPRDGYDVEPATKTLVSGTNDFTMALMTSCTQHLRAEDADSQTPNYTGNNSSSFTVTPAAIAGLQLILPGETALPGYGEYGISGGKTGSPSNRTAGIQFTAAVSLVDTYFNVRTEDNSTQVWVETNDLYDAQPSTQTLNTGTAYLVDTKLVTATTFHVFTTGNNASKTNDTSPLFTVVYSTPTKLQVILPGETAVPGKTPYTDNTGGKTGSPSTKIAGAAFSITVYATDDYWNRITANPDGAPSVKITSPDPLFIPPSDASLNLGFKEFNLANGLRTAWSTNTVCASDIDGSLPNLAASTSTIVRIYPKPAYYMKFSEVPASAVAGSPIYPRLTIYDDYGNICSTGTNVYQNSVIFSVPAEEQFIGKQAPTIPANITFTSLYAGTTVLYSGHPAGPFVLKKAGNLHIHANQVGNATISTNRTPLSTDPTITVSAAPIRAVLVSPNIAAEDPTNVSATVGRRQIEGQVVDEFENYISSQGITCYITVRDTGTSTNIGSVKDDSSVVWTSTTTDTGGKIGGSLGNLYYYVSTRKDDFARVWIATMAAPSDVSQFVSQKQNISAKMLTIGGSPTKLAFISSPTVATAGIYTEKVKYVVERRDDFDNPTEEGGSDISLYLPSGDLTAHTGSGKNYQVNFGFRNADDNFVQNVLIPYEGLAADVGGAQYVASRAAFWYNDEMASVPVGEDNRTGDWSIKSKLGTYEITHNLPVNSAQAVKVTFDNPTRTLTAGKPKQGAAVVDFEVELQDTFNNPVFSTAPCVVDLSVERTTSKDYDAYGFSNSTVTFQSIKPTGGFVVQITSVTIPLGAYYATFYYLDTCSKELQGAVFPRITAAPQWAISSSTNGPSVVADGIDRIVFPQTYYGNLTAGTTSGAVWIQTRDIYSNPSAVTNSGGEIFDLTSNGTGWKKFYSPYGGWSVGTGQCKMNLGEKTTFFYYLDVVVATPTLTARRNPDTWTAETSSVNIVASRVESLAIEFPGVQSRRLIADTTVQWNPDYAASGYTVGTTTDTRFIIRTRDLYGNITAPPINMTIDLTSNSGGRKFASQAEIEGSGFGSRSDILIPAGESSVVFYYKDTITKGENGTVITIVENAATQAALRTYYGDSNYDVVNATRSATVTPNKAYIFSCAYSVPQISVNTDAGAQLIARDEFGNIATGDAVNGRYYVGTASVGVVGITGQPGIPSANQVTFAAGDAGVKSITVQSEYIDDFILNATDYVTNSPSRISGYTGSPGSPYSSVNLETIGGLALPTDQAPETNDNKQQFQIPTNLYQGDGYRVESPASIPMMRLNLRADGGGTLIVERVKVEISPTASGSYSDIGAVELWYDESGNTLYDGETELGNPGSALDTFIASGTMVAGSPPSCWIDFTSNPQSIGSSPRNYFITVRIPATAIANKTLGLQIMDVGVNYFDLGGGSVKLAANYYPFYTYNSLILTEPPKVYVTPTDTAAWWDPPGISSSLAKWVNVDQGIDNTGMLKLGMVTSEFEAYLESIRIIPTGTGSTSRRLQNISKVKIWRDRDGTETLTAGDSPSCGEVAFSTNIAAPTYLYVNNVNDIDVPPTAGIMEKEITDDATAYFFLSYNIGASAEIGDTIGLNIPELGIGISGGDLQTGLPAIQSNEPNITPVIDTLSFLPRTQPEEGETPDVVTQGQQNVPMGRFKLSTDDNAAIWKQLKVKRTGIGQASDSDITAVKVWYDINDNGLFEPTSDQLISPSRYFGQPPDNTGEVNLTIYGPFDGQEILKSAILRKTYFVTYDFSYFAAVGNTQLGLTIVPTGYITITSPDIIDPESQPYNKKTGDVMEYPDTVICTPNSLAPVTLQQGTTNVAMLRFNMKTTNSWSPWNGVKIKRLGNSRDDDVTLTGVKIAKDNGDGTFNAVNDTIIGTGYFNNYGIPGEADVRFSTWPVNYTQQISTYTQYFYVVYDLKDTAVPDFYIGAGFENINSTNSALAAAQFDVGSDNYMGTTNLPFTTYTGIPQSPYTLLVPTPRIVTVVPTDLERTASALGAGIALSETDIPIDPANGGAAAFDTHSTTGRRVLVDSEIIYYTGVLTGSPYNTLTGGVRGDPALANTAVSGHGVNTTVWKAFVQSETNVPLLKLSLSCNGYNVKWTQLRLKRETLAGGDVLDSDVLEIKVWRDAAGSNSGKFSADDVMISTGLYYPYKFGTPGVGYEGTEGMAYIDLNDEEWKSIYTPGVPGSYAVVTTTPTIYFVTFDISQSAREGDSIGCSVFGFKVNDPNTVSAPVIKSATPIIKPTRDIMEVRWENRAKKTVLQSTLNYAMLAVDLRTATREARWTGVKLKKTGTAIDSDIFSVNIYKDTNFSNELEISTVAGQGDVKLTLGTDKLIEGAATINLTENNYQTIRSYEYELLQKAVNPSWNQRYFIAFDINPTAIPGNYAGLIIENTTDFFVVSPDGVEFKSSPPQPQSDFSTITDYNDKVTVELYD